MRWLAIWLLLTAVYFVLWAAVHAALAGDLAGERAVSGADLVRLLLTPALQVAALAGWAAVRRAARQRGGGADRQSD
jgi:hypothetical protein